MVRILERPSEELDMEVVAPLRIAFDTPFTRDLVDRRAERYVRDVVSRLASEVTGLASTIPSGKCGFVLIMLSREAAGGVDESEY